MKKGILFLLILIPTVALLYFGLTRDPRTLPSALLGKPALSFDLEKIEGGRFSLSEAAGKPLVLNFWSTWCGSCAAEHRVIQRAVNEYSQKGVLFYSILYEDTTENAKKFVARYGEGAPILLDPNLRTAIDYGVAGVPETFFIDRAGRVLYKHAGPLNPVLVREKIGELLAGGVP